MDEFPIYLEKYQFCQQQCLSLYQLLFQEYIYAFAYDYGFNTKKAKVNQKENTRKTNIKKWRSNLHGYA